MSAASVIISTYNQPAWLRKTLVSYAAQTAADFELVIADDGSGPETRAVIEAFAAESARPVRHAWHPDRGFRKTEILNRATELSSADYVIYTDGDCPARADFVATHLAHRRPGHFLSGGYLKLGRALSEAITEDDIRSQRCFDPAWLRAQGHPRSIKNWKLLRSRGPARLLNALTPTTPSWNGHNASTWRRDILAANGFDTRMKYGGEDREFGERLVNAGLRPVQLRYSAVCIHLDHDRGYVTPDMIAANAAIRAATRENKSARTPYGIEQGPAPGPN